MSEPVSQVIEERATFDEKQRGYRPRYPEEAAPVDLVAAAREGAAAT